MKYFLLLTFALTSFVSAQSLKVATLDMQKLFDGYYRTTEERQTFSEEFARIQQQNNERLQSLRELNEQITQLSKRARDSSLADNLRQKAAKNAQLKIDEAKAMDRERREYVSRRSRALDMRRRSSMQSILKEIRAKITDYAKQESYDYVFDSSGLSSNQVPFLLYTKDAADITQAILVEINKGAPKTSTPKKEAAPKQ